MFINQGFPSRVHTHSLALRLEIQKHVTSLYTTQIQTNLYYICKLCKYVLKILSFWTIILKKNYLPPKRKESFIVGGEELCANYHSASFLQGGRLNCVLFKRTRLLLSTLPKAKIQKCGGQPALPAAQSPPSAEPKNSCSPSQLARAHVGEPSLTPTAPFLQQLDTHKEVIAWCCCCLLTCVQKIDLYVWKNM